jgi:hypothetical protein
VTRYKQAVVKIECGSEKIDLQSKVQIYLSPYPLEVGSSKQEININNWFKNSLEGACDISKIVAISTKPTP